MSVVVGAESSEPLVDLLLLGAGGLAGFVLKDVFSKSFERWKQRQQTENVYQHFRDPLVLSACELASRLAEILRTYPTEYLTTSVLSSEPSRQLKNSSDDPYFKRHKLVSTGYRFCTFLGWIELFRQELTFLHPGDASRARKVEHVAESIRSDLADGQLNTAEDWATWRDVLVFREEQRAIGESLIEMRGTTRTVVGYGRFCELWESETPNAIRRWLPVMLNFLLDPEPSKDFRRVRLQRALVHLIDLVRLVDATKPIEPHLEAAYQDAKQAFLGAATAVEPKLVH